MNWSFLRDIAHITEYEVKQVHFQNCWFWDRDLGQDGENQAKGQVFIFCNSVGEFFSPYKK